MAKKETLYKALLAKNDEFYTRYEDIEKEIYNYRKYFEGKTVLCNCDDPMESNFTKYFILNFRFLKLKRLICTFYDIGGKMAYVFTYDGQDINGDGIINEADIQEMVKMKAFRHALMDDLGFDFNNKEESWAKGLYGSGDFRSQHCIEYLKRADVVVTNPPFSLFTDYIGQLIEYGKSFLIIGPLTAVGYKETFYRIKNNEVWLGMNHVTDFQKYGTLEMGKVACRWFTNIDNKKRSTPIDLYKRYSNEYPHYANYDGIDCKAVSDIPVDYKGNIGVPISFLDNYCPSQFKIVGLSTGKLAKEIGIAKGHRAKCGYGLEIYENGKYIEPFKRILIKFIDD